MKKTKTIKHFLFTFLFGTAFHLLLLPVTAEAQRGESVIPKPEMRKWNLNFYGGNSLATTALVITPFTGSSTPRSGYFNPTGGIALEYTALPSMSFYTSYDFQYLQDEDKRNRNLTHVFTLGTNIYLRNLFAAQMDAGWFNPYVSLNFGQTNFTWYKKDADGNYERDRNDWYGHYGYNVGSKFRLGSRVDLIVAYHYRYHNPQVRILAERKEPKQQYENDRIAGLITGISVKFGSSDLAHSIWYSPEQASREWRSEIAHKTNEQGIAIDKIVDRFEDNQLRMSDIEETLLEELHLRGRDMLLDAVRHFVLSQQAFFQGEFRQAMNHVERSLNIYETDYAIALKGSITYVLGDPIQASELWEKAYERNPGIAIPSVELLDMLIEIPQSDQ